MKVSVVTACLNNEDTIEDSMKSLASQDYEDIEHIVQDGMSTDNTLEIVKRYHLSSLIESASDLGLYDALNKGIERSQGDIIGLLHSDDFYASSDVISRVVGLFQVENCDAVYTDLIYVDRNDPEKVVRRWKAGKYKDGDFLEGWMPPHTTLFFKKSMFEKYGGFDLRFKSAADYEWMLRVIHKHKIQLAYLPEECIKMKVGGQSNKSLLNRIKANLEDRKAWKVNDLKPKWYTLIRKPLSKVSQLWS